MNKIWRLFLCVALVIIIIVAIAALVGFAVNYKKSDNGDKENTIEKFNNYVNVLDNLNYKQPKHKFNIPMYYINLEKSKDRNNKIINQKKKYDLSLQRVDGIYGNSLESNQSGEIFLTPSKKVKFINKFLENDDENTKPVLGCLLSHIKAIFTAFENNDNIAMILEDDISLITYNHWSYKLDKIIKKAPLDWRIINLYHFCKKEKNIKFILNNEETCGSTVCYIINKKGIDEIINSVFKENTIIIEKNDMHNKIPSDYYIYNLVKTYHYNGKVMLFPDLTLQSTIHSDHFQFQLNNTIEKIQKFLKLIN